VSTQYNELSGRSVERLQTLADGVFAVAMTLLVLDLRLPETEAGSSSELWSQVTDLAPQFAAYLLSFTMLATFWLAEHTLLERCRTSDRMFAWACLAFLFFVSTLPFSASTLASHTELPLAVGIYWANLLGLGLTLGWQLWRVDRAQLFDDPAAAVLVRRRLVLAQTLYAVAALVSLASPQVSIAALALVQLFFIVSPRLPFRT
jgi:TMEM175 potassium channel family protein